MRIYAYLYGCTYAIVYSSYMHTRMYVHGSDYVLMYVFSIYICIGVVVAHTSKYVDMYVYMLRCIYVHMCIYVVTCALMYLKECICIVHSCIAYEYIHIHIRMCACLYICVHVPIYKYVCISMNIGI